MITIEEIQKYNKKIPRYTSYPTVPNWQTSDFGPEQHIANLKAISDTDSPLSMYIHIPFCIRRCKFCACNTIITRNKDKVDEYLYYLKKEIRSVHDFLENRDKVIQLHFGGGTPTHLSESQLNDLLGYIHDIYSLNNAEKSIEIHPSVTTFEQIDVLSDFNFNRISVGVQDFDPIVQDKLNRHQTFDETAKLIKYSRKKGFSSVNMDLIYGLPYQTHEGFMNTISKLWEIKPDRIAVYSYAHFPQMFPHHRSIPLDVLPTVNQKFQLFIDAREHLLNLGYKQIGFDHFALETDDLWKSFLDKTLRRNFMGYNTRAGTDLIAFGYSAISELSNSYAQNSKNLSEYKNLIEKYGTATVKGHQMSSEDKYYKKLIMDIMCLGKINIDKTHLSSNMLSNMDKLVNESLCIPNNGGWELTDKGMLFARLVASNFDQYLNGEQFNFSNVI